MRALENQRFPASFSWLPGFVVKSAHQRKEFRPDTPILGDPELDPTMKASMCINCSILADGRLSKIDLGNLP